MSTDRITRSGGVGQFSVEVVSSDPARAGPAGIVSIEFRDDKTAAGKSSMQIDDDVVIETLHQLRSLGLSVIPSGEALQLVPDTFIWSQGKLFLVRPLARRNWTVRQALRDAEQIVRDIQARQKSGSAPEVHDAYGR